MSLPRLALLFLAAPLALPGVARAEEATIVARDVPVGAARALAASGPPERFNLVGLHWQGPGAVSFRTRSVSGRWSTWRLAAPEAEDGPNASSAEAAPRRGWRLGNPYWTGPSDRIQYRKQGIVRRLRAFFVWSPVAAEDEAPRSLTVTATPAIVPRLGWGANERIRRGRPRYSPSLRFALVHHTAGSNSYSAAQAPVVVRAIQLYHVRGNGWDDIGYNFLVDRFGRVYEGRSGGVDRNVVGAHAAGFNTSSVGVAVLGNYNGASLSAPARSALARLLAWRLDVAHVDPLSALTWPSGGNAKFASGVPVFLRAISGHRDSGFTSCPGTRLYAQLGSLAQQVSGLGLPKLYEPAANRLGDGRVRFTARLSAELPWTVTVTDLLGREVGSGSGIGMLVDWTWDSRALPLGRYTYTIGAGTEARPAAGTVSAGAALVLTLADVSVAPATVSPNGDGYAEDTTVSYSLGVAATVTSSLLNAEGATVTTLFSLALPAGRQSFRWAPGTLADGRYTLMLTARTPDGREVVSSAGVLVSRTLGWLSALPPVFSPNRDGRLDALALAFTLGSPATVTLDVRRAGRRAGIVFTGPLQPGQHRFSWPGAGASKLADGRYEAVVTAVDALGALSQRMSFVSDSTPPRLRLVRPSTLRFWVSEAATVTTLVDGRRVVQSIGRRGQFNVAWRGPYEQLVLTARDVAGNDSPPLRYPPRPRTRVIQPP